MIPNGKVRRLAFYTPPDPTSFFDSLGVLRRSVGQRGEGPGDFTSIDRIWLEGDSIRVLEMRAAAETFLTVEGDLIERRSLPFMFPRATYPIVPLADGGWLVTVSVSTHEGRGVRVDSVHVVRWGENGLAEAQVAMLRGAPRFEDLGNFPLLFSALVPYAPRPGVLPVGDSMVIVSAGDAAPLLTVSDLNGEQVRTIPVPDASRVVGPEERTAFFEAYRRDALSGYDGEALAFYEGVLRDFPIPARTPPHDGGALHWDPARETVWVAEHRPMNPVADTLRLAVLRPDGRVLGRIELPGGREILDISPDHVLILFESELGEHEARIAPVSCR